MRDPGNPQMKTCASPSTSRGLRFPEELSSDLFHYGGRTYLLVVDRYSGFVWTVQLKNQDAASVIKEMSKIFDDFGLPFRLRTDNGPCYRSEFSEFCERNGIQHVTSSPYHARSNGHAEAAVKQMKHLLERCHANWQLFRQALREWRNTTRSDGNISPAQLFFGRRQRTLAPALPSALMGHASRDENGLQQLAAAKENAKQRHDEAARELPKIPNGAFVRVLDRETGRWDDYGEVISASANGRSYELRIDGKITRRNRRFLKPLTQILSQERRNLKPNYDEKAKVADQNAAPSETKPSLMTPSLKKPRKKKKTPSADSAPIEPRRSERLASKSAKRVRFE